MYARGRVRSCSVVHYRGRSAIRRGWLFVRCLSLCCGRSAIRHGRGYRPAQPFHLLSLSLQKASALPSNQRPALSAADVGIAVNSGAAIAREIADVTIAADDLFELVNLRKLSDALMKRIHSNYRFVIGFNGALIGLGAVGVLQPATSALLHNASTLGVSLRSMTNLLD